MPTINIAPKAMQNGDNVTVYKDTVGPQQQTYTFLTSQERVILKNSGSKNITYTVGSQSGSLGPSQSVDVKETINSINLTAEQGTQQFEIWADELGSVGGSNVDLTSFTTALEGKAKQSDIRANYSSTRDTVFFSKDTRFNAGGGAFTSTNWALSDYIKNDRDLTVKGYATTGQPCIVLYNSDLSIKSYINADVSDSGVYSKTTTVTKDSCSFIRVQSSYGLSLFATVSYQKDIKDSYVKADYTANPIFFNVSVNQNFPDNTSITTSVQDTESFQDVSCALYLPIDYRAIGKPSKIAICCHGAGGQITSSSTGELAGFTALLSAGYAVFDVNGSNNNYTDGTSDHMGSPRTISACLKAFDYIKNNYNVETKLYVHGHSMGGLTALNLAIQNPEIVKVVGLFHPVSDLYNQAWLSPWFPETKAMIAKEYNFADQTGATWEHDKVVGFNPIENHSFLNGTDRYNFFPTPLKIWHGNADTTVSLSGSQALVTAFKNAGIRCALRVLDGVAHTRTTTMYTEETVWFNRF